MRPIGGRRRFLRGAAGALATLAGYAAGQAAPRRIELVARKFEFTPAEISVTVGQPVTLVIRTLDFAHGVSLPDFERRADCLPGREVEISFTPDKVGRFGFVCDNFCGDGHDQMSGLLIVTGA